MAVLVVVLVMVVLVVIGDIRDYHDITCICEAWRSMVIMWSAPDTDNMFATSFAEIGARLYKDMGGH